MVKIKNKKPKYRLNSDGEFLIENYNFAKPFANFFPGIAGKYGIPMWVFYVNRGQAIASFGTKDKDHAILEFFPANRAWQLVSLVGFRTFIKVFAGLKTSFYEPFQSCLPNLDFNLRNEMSISSSDLKISETNLSLGLGITVEYFNIPQDSYAGLARIVTIQNLSRLTKKIQLLDGLPQIVPYGTSNLFLKKLSRTIEAWMNVENLDQDVAFYKLDVDPTDRPEVIHIEDGNFYLGFHYQKEKPKIIRPIVDPQSIFGPVIDFSYPRQFLAAKNFRPPKEEIAKSKTPSGFLLLNLELAPGEQKSFYSVIGHMKSRKILNSSITKITASGYLSGKKEENKKIIQELQSDINTESGLSKFDLYAKQTYLDNIIRGGYPIIFKPSRGAQADSRHPVFYLYLRKHGDLERDYNKFQIQPTYFSQGNGNYRDTNQNRRNDTWFNPDIEDENVVSFFNLLQADGFNPLVVKGASFLLKDSAEFKKALTGLAQEIDILKIVSFLNKPFAPGELILFIEENKIKLNVSYDEFLNVLLPHCIKNQEAEHGEGFWSDHWTYNLDLLEGYLAVFPEKIKEIIFHKKVFTFYDNTETVKPRCEKYILIDGLIKQLHAIAPDNTKRSMIKKRPVFAHALRTEYGKAEIYQTTLMNKLLCLLVNKMASLDPFGCGIEMEADKPNWFDALNGLPALFGSSICETFELKRLALFIKRALEKTKEDKFNITEEIYNFLIDLDGLIKEYLNDGSADKDYRYWDKSYSLKEDYRYRTKLGLSGKELEIKADGLTGILNNALKKIDSGLNKARDAKTNIYYAYFINEVVEYEPLKPPFIKPLKFRQRRLPFFLEAQMHALRLSDDVNKTRNLYKATKASELYDKKLKMYKVTAPLTGMPQEIGRCRAFTPGWLENESIWLHMEYKYMLELLKGGLYEEFYQDFKTALIPFQKPKNYGRSILENVSFLVSSSFPDKNLHGNGFVARLSGSTAEFLHIWLIMNLGRNPFFLNEDNALNLRFQPVLCGWLFDRKGYYSFNFLSKIKVNYHNPKRKNTFGKNAAKIKKIIFIDKDGRKVEIASDTVPSPYAQQIRSRQIKHIDIYLA